MKLFGFEITRVDKALTEFGYGYGGVSSFGGWWPIVREPWTGAWQHNQYCRFEDITAFHAVFACVTLIASDISKLGVNIIRLDNGVWQKSASAIYDPLLRTPNHYQNYIQFWESWILSKLLRGNAYILKERDQRNVVARLYVLDPARVRVLVSDQGNVFYQLMDDRLAGQLENANVPASEVIHDRMNCLYHPLCGIPPLYAAGLAARQGLKIQTQSLDFYDNNAMPGGVLTSPTRIPEQSVEHMKKQWEVNYGGMNRGKVAVLGNGLKFEPIAVTQRDAQMLETAKATSEWVCSVFHVPPYKIGIGAMPSYNNIQALNVEYYSQCLQSLIESAEVCLDQGLELKNQIGVQFDVETLLRMDTVSQISSLKESVLSGMHAPNEARAKLGLPPKPGGESPYLQQQNYSLAALNKRDTQDNPFGSPAPAAPPAPAPEAPPPKESQHDNRPSPQERATLVRQSAERIFKLAKRRVA